MVLVAPTLFWGQDKRSYKECTLVHQRIVRQPILRTRVDMILSLYLVAAPPKSLILLVITQPLAMVNSLQNHDESKKN